MRLEQAVLALDTATDDTCVGACRAGEVLYESSTGPGEGGRPSHATAVLPALEEAAAAAGGWPAVTRIAVGLGPGSFTGLRIGIATARGAGAAAAVPVVGVGTLDALAAPALEVDAAVSVLATIDARRGEVFAALYGGGERLWDPFVAAPDVVSDRLRKRGETVLAVGSGALRFRDELSLGAEIPDDSSALHRVAARHVCALGARVAPGAALEPTYLRPPDAERWRDRNASRTSQS